MGGANTAIDFGLLFLLKALGLPIIPANLISTTTAFIFSFFANKKYTFRAHGTNLRREITLFVIVTLFGLWVLQTVVIQAISALLTPLHLGSETTLLVAKAGATLVSLTWNYLLYSRVVFKKDQRL